MKVSVSILSNKYNTKDLIDKLNNSVCDYIHLDIMDGVYVETKTWTIGEIKKLSKIIHKPLDIHLMVKNPLKYIDAFSLLNSSFITFHSGSVKDIPYVISIIKSYGIKVGLALNPDEDISLIEQYLPLIDLVLVMAVKPGKCGQSFNDEIVVKVDKLKEIIDANNYNLIISVDGGINNETALLLNKADMLVSASYVQENINENIHTLLDIDK
ncbi:MAG: ribulose-phosphate 3-epimerase [Bacilli bacterium]